MKLIVSLSVLLAAPVALSAIIGGKGAFWVAFPAATIFIVAVAALVGVLQLRLEAPAD